MITSVTHPFENDLAVVLGDAMRQDERIAVNVYAALCNATWVRSDGSTFACTWRQASELVSRIRGLGEHDLEFYGSGNDGGVASDVAAALLARGWTHTGSL